jgi:hypothetical protein
MAKQTPKEKSSAKKKIYRDGLLSLEPMNYKIILAGVLVIVLGYFALGTSPWDGFMALTVAPILLVTGYCVVIPFGIIYRKKKTETPVDSHIAGQNIS